jgi:N-acetylmuramoyl-L-alanine amidase
VTSDEAVIVLDAGHGGQAPVGGSSPHGVRGQLGTLEKDVTLRIAHRVAAHLGSGALLTRSGDQNLGLAARAELARRHGAGVFVSLHANDGAPGARGSEIYLHPRAGAASRALAESLRHELSLPDAPAVVREAQMAVLAPERLGPTAAACLVEVDYLSDPESERRLRGDAPLEARASALAQGIRRFLQRRRAPVAFPLAVQRWGIDTDTVLTDFVPALAATPLPGSVAQQGATVDFVCRYLRNMTAAEVRALGGAGIPIVSVFEQANNAGYFTYDQGRRDAGTAIRQASALGQPHDAPIYFAVDYDDARFYSGNFGNVDDYFRGVNDVMGASDQGYPSVGVYGGACVLDFCERTGRATYFWQSLSTGWCGNAKARPNTHIRQLTPPNAPFAGVINGAGATLVVDFDVSDGANEGSWLPPAPAP